MFSNFKRWMLLAALAAGASTTCPLVARAEALDQMQSNLLAEALIPYAKREYVRALALLTPLAERGNAVAQLKLGIIFSRGKTDSPDHVAAIHWFTKAAENGQAEAQFELGRMYRDGVGTRVDSKLALYWLVRAAEKDMPEANNAVGELYLGRIDLPQDFLAAIGWFLRGAVLGNSASMYNLGVRYARGEGVPRDDIEALRWFNRAAGMGIGSERDNALRARTQLTELLTPVEVSWAEDKAEAWSLTRAHFREMIEQAALGQPSQE